MLHAAADVETHLIVTESAQQTIQYETGWTMQDVCALADTVHQSVAGTARFEELAWQAIEAAGSFNPAWVQQPQVIQ